ncbi:hypothetical protein CYMTET_14418 [Cymbomonas tetramitiformis]|uniref:Uncharacterized protein n=1 Tax=Cymbomonas tetramitiformis TaxID=36881 RepID=A0AAE0GGL8_9CHLO|nr:hypothetical protein CYMTET_14418 [Cymbomonas tetramitiformis]
MPRAKYFGTTASINKPPPRSCIRLLVGTVFSTIFVATTQGATDLQDVQKALRGWCGQAPQCRGAPRPWVPGQPRLASLRQGPVGETPISNASAASVAGEEDEALRYADGWEDSQIDSLEERISPTSRRLQGKDTLSEKCKTGKASKGVHASNFTELVACLKNESHCSASCTAVARQARMLAGVKMLKRRIPCFSVTRPGACSTLVGNPETTLRHGIKYSNAARPSWDLEQPSWRSCAIVGNAPVMRLAQNGNSIDGHSAVWRFNLKGATHPKFQVNYGRRTSIRMFNSARSRQLGRGRGGLPRSSNEMWLFWYMNSVDEFQPIKARYKKIQLRLISPKAIRWLLDAYMSIRADFDLLGLGPFKCPTSLSSGIHATLLSLRMCSSTNLFGFTYTSETLDGGNVGYKGHAWNFDIMLLRLLHLAGDIQICTGE